MPVWDVFSKRNKPLPDPHIYDDLPQTLRNQVLLLWRRTLDNFDRFGDPYTQIREIICSEHGKLFLGFDSNDARADVHRFAHNPSDTSMLLDLIEESCKFMSFVARKWPPYKEAALDGVQEINHRFREAGVGYYFDADSGCLICVKNLILHQEVVRPALHLLTAPGFESANEEYLKAHQRFREGHYDDCLTECCAAFESTIKIVCDKKGWTYNQTDTASKLVDTLMANTSLPPYFRDPLIIIGTLRNKLSAHGQGTQPAQVPEHLAKYALHATANAIVLIVDATS